MSLTGQTAWVVGGVGVIGRGIARGLLKAGATVVVNSRSEERLERIVEELNHPERLITVHASLLPDKGAARTVDDTLASLASKSGLASSTNEDGKILNHVVAHGAVRYWTTRRVGCDETYSLNNNTATNNVLDLSPDDFLTQSSQLAALHFSAAQHLMPKSDTYTFVTGDGSGHPSTRRSAMGEINSHHVWGLSAALRRQLTGAESTTSTPICREVRVGLPINRPDTERAMEPRKRPLSEDIGDLCAGMAAAAATEGDDEQGKFIRIETIEGLEELLVKYHADADKEIGPLPSFAEFVGSL